MATEAAEYDEKIRKKKEEESGMWDEYMEQRRQARIKEEEDLKKLKERQVSRNDNLRLYNRAIDSIVIDRLVDWVIDRSIDRSNNR